MRVAIVDDKIDVVLKIEDKVKAFFADLGVAPEILKYTSGNAFIKSGLAGFDVVFLDIVLGDMSGLEIAERVSNEYPSTEIIFVSDHLIYAMDGYDYKILQFVYKEDFEESMTKSLNALAYQFMLRADPVEMRFVEGQFTIPQHTIVYVDYYYHKLTFHLHQHESNRESVTLWRKLADVQPMLDDTMFVRAHKSYLVGIRFIENVNDGKVFLTTGDSLAVSRQYYPQVKNRFQTVRQRFGNSAIK